MEKINISKDLISALKVFTKHSTNNISDYLNYNVDTQKALITDGHKLLSMPSVISIIDHNRESLSVNANFNWKFYSKYCNKCNIYATEDHYKAIINNDIIAETLINNNFPDVSRVLSTFNYDLNLVRIEAKFINTRLNNIVKTIKDYNAIQKLKKLPLYDIYKAYITFSSYIEDGYTFINARINLKDDEFNNEISNKIDTCLLDYCLPKNETLKNSINVSFKFFQFVDCIETLKKVSNYKDYTITFNFDTSEGSFSPIKLDLIDNSFILLMPCKIS